MQKLWRASTGLGPVLATAGWLELRASRPLSAAADSLSSFPMPAAIHLRPSPSPPLHRAVATPRALGCSCGLGAGVPPRRAWLPLLRHTWSPYSTAWLHGAETRGFRAVEGLRNRDRTQDTDRVENEVRKEDGSGGEEEEEVVVEGERRSRAPTLAAVERRQRGRSSASPPVGNLDLLAIPGVGPRNLRKLVDKGFGGVAQLKQLYRDKV